MSKKINHCYLGRHNTYYFRLRTPRKICHLFPEVRKEIRISLRTSFIEESRIKSNHIYFVLSRLFVDIFDYSCNNQNQIEGINHFNINDVIDNVIKLSTKGFENMFNNIRTFGFETHNNGISLKSLQGDTEEERRRDFERYQEYFNKILPHIDNIAPNVENSVSENTQDHSRLKQATFSELIDKFSEYKRQNGWDKEETFNGFYQKLKIILELVGDHDCSDLTQDSADKFLSDLTRLPKNSNKGKLASLSIQEKLNLPTDQYKGLSKASINKYVSLFKAVTLYGADRDPGGVGGLNYLHYDIGKKLSFAFDKSKDTNSYSAFTDEELQSLFDGYVYNDLETKHRKSDDFIFWILLIAAYTGARVNEMAQLLVNDVKFDEKSQIWYINILDDENSVNKSIKQSVKTESSRRKVPIHSKLIELGFLDFVQKKRYGRYSNMLFSTGLSFSKKGKWGKNVSTWFNGDASRGNGYKVTCGIERNSGKVFHSFRHSFAKKLLEKKGKYVDVSIIGALIGHEQIKNSGSNKVTFIYTENYSLSVLKAAIEELEYDINLEHVSYAKFLKKFSKKRKLK